MSMFGESKEGENMNWLLDDIERFYEEGGTTTDLFDVLKAYFEYYREGE